MQESTFHPSPAEGPEPPGSMHGSGPGGMRGVRRAAGRLRHSFASSPLTRRIIIINLIALNVMVAGIFYLNATRESLVVQRAEALVAEAELIANVFEARMRQMPGPKALLADKGAVAAALDALSLRNGIEVFIFDDAQRLLGQTRGSGSGASPVGIGEQPTRRTPVSNALTFIWGGVARLFTPASRLPPPLLEDRLRTLVERTLTQGAVIRTELDTAGGAVISATAAIRHEGAALGVVAVASPAGEIDALVHGERERVLQMFVVALAVSVGLSLVLSSTIANPLARLAEAAELGRERNLAGAGEGRVRIPDLSARADEIGRLSRALSGMVAALYNRIEGNEQFAADVAHEIKNPLASLQSAVGTLRRIQRADQRERLLEVIEHDVRRLDRLVSDISNASRLDAELVKEEQESFDLLQMLGNLNTHLAGTAARREIDYITDLPAGPIMLHGLEARLAQVFVNLITNAISFCEPGDAIRVWVRERESRVLVVVEDTGPGIPEEALDMIFRRFYSQRPEQSFGDNSGLGLAISRQIVEAHGGVIWAENIRPTDADPTSEPLGARFVVGLPA